MQDRQRAGGVGAKANSFSRGRHRGRQTAAHQVSECAVLNRANDLSAGRTKLCQHFREVDRTEVIHMLDRVIEQDALPFAPCDREINGQKKREACRTSLAALKDELGVHLTIDLQG